MEDVFLFFISALFNQQSPTEMKNLFKGRQAANKYTKLQTENTTKDKLKKKQEQGSHKFQLCNQVN